MVEVIDPNNNERLFKNWKRSNLEGLFSEDKKIIEQFISDMEQGKNVNRAKKGGRSYSRLNCLKNRIPFMAKWAKQYYNRALTKLSEDDVINLFHRLKSGTIEKKSGGKYISYGEYIKDFKSFWHWYMRISRKKHKESEGKQGAILEDITLDVEDSEQHKPKFVYITFEQFKKLYDHAKPSYKVLMITLFDSGIRAPKELMNIRVMDLKPIKDSDKGELTIRPETSKNKYGRVIKLMMSYPDLKDFIINEKLKPDDFVFNISPPVVNRYIKRLAYRHFKIGTPKPKEERYKGKTRTIEEISDGLTMYDFRHCSACYWLPKYPTQSALMYRMGWKNIKMIEYYTEFLGMKDTISDADLVDSIGKSELQKSLEIEKNKREMLEEHVKAQERQMTKMNKILLAWQNQQRFVKR